MLNYSHDWRLVLAAFAIALMAGFTGLSLTRGASKLDISRRKSVVSMAAVALGGGIWSMHFVAMLGLQLPIFYFYDGLTTLISALVAILLTGLSLLILHFRPRSGTSKALAGAIVGVGISLMHYIGMSGMELCRPVYTPAGVFGALAASIGLSILAVRVAYSDRGRRNIVIGTVCFGTAVVMVHFIAMAGTAFEASGDQTTSGPALDNETLALLVTLAAFLISSAFLLTSATFAPNETPEVAKSKDGAKDHLVKDEVVPARDAKSVIRIPHEKEGRAYFVDASSVAALRAEGHYTLLYRGTESLFCPWSISEAEERLAGAGFIRVHRSFLLNPSHVAKFERNKDTAECQLLEDPKTRIPVSRTRLAELREVLGL
ncbi:MHYT domain-containing protein [Thioclava sp. FR2]|uniref:MHYT domain-containing protein n=1 Tax=Thioclava sp. FR2 TaxID=3445780 RepID=UPI003EBB544D